MLWLSIATAAILPFSFGSPSVTSLAYSHWSLMERPHKARIRDFEILSLIVLGYEFFKFVNPAERFFIV